jgi:outer membrane immunogenic protein
MLKKVTATVVVGLAVVAGGHALADGMPRGSLKDVPVCCAAPSWTGFYIGGGIGYGHLQGENNYWEPGFSQSWKGEGAAGGLGTVVLGFNRQFREKYVAGVFVEYDWSNIEISYIDSTITNEQTFRVEQSINVGARAGFLLTPSSLLYVTGGYSWAKGKNDGYFDIQPTVGPLLPGKSTSDLNGPFVGLGMETQLGHNFALRGEARYTMFSDEIVNSGSLFGTPYEDHFKANLLAARLVLTYKLNRDEPVSAPLK